MLVSYKWLKELVDIDATSHELSEKMSTTGIEVEGVSNPSEGLSKIVVGQVLSCEDVPETHLHLCQIKTGDDDVRQVVCGAPNIKAGIKVIVALPGARIADNYKIKKGKIRGMESLGMVCSLQELGVSESIIPKEYSEGIHYLPEDAIVGESVFPYLDMDDEIIELSITPNRADALSMRGVAYEVAAIYDKTPTFNTKVINEISEKVSERLSLNITTDKVKTYKARVLKNVTIKESPQWLQNRLMNAGIRPLNTVVDVTNYVLLYFGQPMHAFDFDKFDGNVLGARLAKDSEKLVTLDGEERDLSSEDIIITVDDKAVALAGVMGGQSTEISSDTRTVVLEAALFDGKSIRKTSSRLNLRSESSARFEKGINVETIEEALDYAAAMIQELSGGDILSDTLSYGEVDTEPLAVTTNLTYVNTRLGTALTLDEIKKIFQQLEFEVSVEEENVTVYVPKRRWDITIQADLVEEIARIYGYDNLPSTLPSTSGTAGELTKVQQFSRHLQTLAEGAGLSEVISYTLTTPEKSLEFAIEPTHLTELMWPMSVERSVLRQNLVSGILDIVSYNSARKNTNVALYEMGRIFKQTGNPKEDLPEEINSFALAISGLILPKDFQTPAIAVDFFYVKGILEMIFDKLGLSADYQTYQGLSSLHPGRTAKIMISGQTVGYLGQVHPQTAKAYSIPETYVAELDLDKILSLLPSDEIFTEITKYPAVNRDIALLVSKEISHQDIIETIKSAGVKRLTDIKLFDVYQGNNMAQDKKSMAYSLTFQNPTDNLTDEEVATYMTKISTALIEKLGVEVR
ncbi:MAG: phenylalanine--tRNA ligase subunit beta [Streptococcus sp.]|nr:phenylalanine--tRNA ligase subunit beta [Streptococcus sp.]